MVLNLLLLALIPVAVVPGADSILLEYKMPGGDACYFQPPRDSGRVMNMFPLTAEQRVKAPKVAGIRLDVFIGPGGTPKVEPAVVFGSLEGGNVDSGKLLRETLGVYTLPQVIGESLTINAFERYGLEPVVLRVVSARPDKPRPLEIVNRTQSLALLRSEEFRHQHVFTVQNTGSRPVIAYSVGTSSDFPSLTTSAGKLKSLIDPGGSREFSLVLSPLDRQFFIHAVIFADLGWEGDPVAAARLLAMRQGSLDAERRALNLIDTAMASIDGRTAEALMTTIKAIPETPDEPAVQTIMASCSLPETSRPLVRDEYRRAIGSEKSSILRSIERCCGGGPINNRLRELRQTLVRE